MKTVNWKLVQGATHKTTEIEFHPNNNNTLITLAERVSLKMSQGITHRNSKKSIPIIRINLFPAKEFLLLMQYCIFSNNKKDIVQELCESQGGRPGLSVLTSLLVSVDVKLY